LTISINRAKKRLAESNKLDLKNQNKDNQKLRHLPRSLLLKRFRQRMKKIIKV
jgi:hypothetical protein